MKDAVIRLLKVTEKKERQSCKAVDLSTRDRYEPIQSQ